MTKTHPGLRRLVTRAALPCLLSLGLGSAVVALADDRAATLDGTITAPDGARLPGVAVTLLRPDGTICHRVATGSAGTYRMDAVPPGAYVLTAHIEGFASARKKVDIEAGTYHRLDLELELAALREKIDIVAKDARDTVESAALRHSPAYEVTAALDHEVGIFNLRRGPIGQDVALRGLHGADVTVLVDGTRICGACPNRMDPPAFHVDFAEVDRVEISRGPVDVRNLGGLGGTINIATRRPPGGWRMTTGVSAGSAGYVNPSVVASYGGRPYSALLGASYREAGAYRDGSGHRVTEPAGYLPTVEGGDAFRLGSAWGRVMRHNDRGLVQIAYTRQQASHALYPGLQMDAQKDDTDRVQVSFETISLKGQIGYSDVVHDMTDQYRTTGAAAPRGYSMGTFAHSRVVDGRLEWQRGDWSAGTDVQHRVWDTATELAMRQYVPQPSLADATTDSVGGFLEWQRFFTTTLTVTAGARLDHVSTSVDDAGLNGELYRAYYGPSPLSRSDVLASGSVRVRWQRRPGPALWLALGHAERPPEPHERYFALRRMGTDWVGQPNLAPGQDTALELGASYEATRYRLELTLYGSILPDFITVVERDRIEDVPGVTNGRARTWTNVDARMFGADARAQLVLPWHLFLDIDGSWTRGKQSLDPARGITSENLPEIPQGRARAGLRFDNGRLWARLEGTFLGRQHHVDTDLGEQPTAGSGVLDVSTGWRSARWTLAAGVSNLFDRLYYEHLGYQRDPFRSGLILPEPGRQAYLNLSYAF